VLRLTIKSAEVTEKTGTNAKGPWKIREQTARIELNDESRKVVVALNKDAAPYAPGVYEVSDASFYIDNYGGLQLGRLVLRPAGTVARVGVA